MRRYKELKWKKVYLYTKKLIYRLDYKEKLKSICSKRPSKTEVTNEEK